MAKIKVDTDRLRSNSQALQAKIQELETLNRKLSQLNIRIGDSWEGDASQAYRSLMQRYGRQAEEMVSVLTEFKSYVDSATEKFESLDKSSASKLRGSF